MIDGGLRGVQVFGALVVIQELPGAETERLPGDVADGPNQTPTEAVVDVATVTAPQETRAHQLFFAVALRLQVLAEGAATRREADAESLGGRLVETALAQKDTTGLGLLGRQLRDEELFRGLVRRQDARAHAVVGRLAAILIVKFVADARRHALDGLGECDVVHLLQECEDIAALTATEAVVKADLRAHVKARAALLMERAEPLHRADARILECDVVPNDVGDVGARAHLVDVASSNQACHGRNSTVGAQRALAQCTERSSYWKLRSLTTMPGVAPLNSRRIAT